MFAAATITMMKPPPPSRRRRATSALVLAAIACSASSFSMRPATTSSRGMVQLRSTPADASADDEPPDTTVGGGGIRAGFRKNRRKPRRSIADKNLYGTLGADPSMSRADIKRRYIALAKETHPDATTSGRSGDASASASTNGDDDRFNEVARAWTVLSDAKSRRAYDRELAAQDFKDDVVKRAGAVAREYGPAARKLYDDFAIPLLRRTTATTLAGWSAVTDVTATESTSEREEGASTSTNVGEHKQQLSGATLSEVVKEVSEMERTSASAGDPLEDFGRAFQHVIEAGRNATRQIDGVELREKSVELRRRADETQAESMELLERLTEIRSERLRLTFRTSSSANFTSDDATQYLDGFTPQGGVAPDEVTLMQRMTPFKHPVRQDIAAFGVAESDFENRREEKSAVDRRMAERRRALGEAERNAAAAMQAEERARIMLEDARRQVAESQGVVANAQKSVRDLDATVRRADQDLNRASIILKRKRDAVRRELKRKADRVEGRVFDNGDDGTVRLNPGFDRSSMSAMGFEAQGAATIEALRKDERRVEGDLARLVETAGRLASRSERLRIRSEELVGKQRDEMAGDHARQASYRGEVIGDTFDGVTEEMMDAARVSNESWRNATMNSQ